MDERLVDLVCVRETHQSHAQNLVVSMQSGLLLLCPRGETLGHVWKAKPGSAMPDDRRLSRETLPH